MLRLGSSLPIRVLRDAAPKQIPLFPTVATSYGAQQRTFSTTESLEVKRRGALIHFQPRLRKKKRYSDPQAKRVSEARQRKNMARQAVLREERSIALGDPVRGRNEPTAFVRSFDSAMSPEDEASVIRSGTSQPPGVEVDPQQIASETTSSPGSSHSAKDGPSPRYLNSFVTPSSLEHTIEHSKRLIQVPVESRPEARDLTTEARIAKAQEEEHENAREAMARILAVEGANSKQRKHINIQRCIDEFGRHKTDKTLLARNPDGNNQAAAKLRERIGPDTGSSEVQIAILTAKIKKLADEQEGKASQDKVNKRNLRLLVHRRQKLLKYFMKKSRGGPQWEHLVDTLGLTPATWQGEISLQ